LRVEAYIIARRYTYPQFRRTFGQPWRRTNGSSQRPGTAGNAAAR